MHLGSHLLVPLLLLLLGPLLLDGGDLVLLMQLSASRPKCRTLLAVNPYLALLLPLVLELLFLGLHLSKRSALLGSFLIGLESPGRAKGLLRLVPRLAWKLCQFAPVIELGSGGVRGFVPFLRIPSDFAGCTAAATEALFTSSDMAKLQVYRGCMACYLGCRRSQGRGGLRS